MVTFRMCADVKMNRAVDPNKDYISPGGYCMKMGDKFIPFDFEESATSIDKSNPEIIHIEQKNPDYDSFPLLKEVTKEMIERITEIQEIYENGGLILSDRYTTSNAIHQGSKLPEAELPAFFDWLYDLEYSKMGLPRPDLVLYLDVDLPTSLKRMQHRQEKHNTKADIHEQDVAYLENCLRIGRLAAAHYGWTVVPFMKDGAERELEEKHEEIFSIIRSAL